MADPPCNCGRLVKLETALRELRATHWLLVRSCGVNPNTQPSIKLADAALASSGTGQDLARAIDQLMAFVTEAMDGNLVEPHVIIPTRIWDAFERAWRSPSHPPTAERNDR